MNKKSEKKSKEKPISLYPLEFEDAMKTLLNTSPEKDSKNDKLKGDNHGKNNN